MQLSIIIPIYKVEDYLRECIDSVLSQTFKDYEILLVNDGSPDSCPQICDEYASKYDFIRALHKPNGGLSDARNYGLRNASGDYVIFLDSDDFYQHNDFLESVMSATANGSKDAVFFQRTVFYDGVEKSYRNLPLYDVNWMSLSGDEMFYALASHDRLDASACMKATKRSILLKNNLFFKKGIYCEDIEWFSRYVPCVNNIAIINKPDYMYRKRVGSITASLKEKNVRDLFYTIDAHAECIKNSNLSDCKKVALLCYLSYQYYIVLGLCVFVGMKGRAKYSFIKACNKYKWISKYSISPKTKKSGLVFKLLGTYLSSYFFGYYIKNK